MTTHTDHKCLFPCNPPGGSFFAPGPCACGKTYARSQAEQMLAEALAAMDATEPEGGEWHAITSTADVSLDVFAVGDVPSKARLLNKLTGVACEMPFAQWEPFSEELGRGIAAAYHLMHPESEAGLFGDSVADHPDDCRGACCEDARREAESEMNDHA
jgi:hypothetical protein